jgi:ribosomal protein S18 acetylase RimI-like enzyme
MHQVLVLGRKSGGNGYYVHTGDLDWWLYYTELESALWQHIYLWESDSGDGTLDGWALLSPAWSAFDVFVRPELRGSPQAEAIYAFAEERTAEIALRRGGNEVRTIWVGEGDDVLISYLASHGFSLSDVDSEEIACSRAAASQAAFGSDWQRDRYLRRYLDFRRSPVYRPDLDLVSIAPDGRVASFCIVWLDDINRVGLFEPVGTVPQFQRMGLGRAVLTEGMRHMAACGMRTAIVGALGEDAASNGLYYSAGLRPVRRLLTYVKTVGENV